MTPEEYLAWEEQQQVRHEYHDGRLIAMPGGTHVHALLGTNLIILLGTALAGSRCHVLGPDMRIGIGSRRFVYPDLSVVCGEPAFADERRTTLVNPALVVEVLSPSTALHDKGTKFEAYRMLESVQEVVFVDPERPSVEVYRRGAPWTLHEPTADGDVLLLSVGATLHVAAVYAGTELV